MSTVLNFIWERRCERIDGKQCRREERFRGGEGEEYSISNITLTYEYLQGLVKN